LETEEEELSDQGGGGDEGQSTPFSLKRCGKEKKDGTQKRKKYNKTHVDPMVLKKSDLDEIDDKVRDTMTEVLNQFEQKYMKMSGTSRRICASCRSK